MHSFKEVSVRDKWKWICGVFMFLWNAPHMSVLELMYLISTRFTTQMRRWTGNRDIKTETGIEAHDHTKSVVVTSRGTTSSSLPPKWQADLKFELLILSLIHLTTFGHSWHVDVVKLAWFVGGRAHYTKGRKPKIVQYHTKSHLVKRRKRRQRIAVYHQINWGLGFEPLTFLEWQA